MPYKCPIEQKAYYKRVHKRRNEKHYALMQRFKTFKGCSICRYRDNPDGLDFDHIEPILKSKKRTNRDSPMKMGLYSRQALKETLSKCQVLCGTCHRIKSAEENRNRNEGRLH